MPLDRFRCHWQILRVFQHGKMLKGKERIEALRRWNRGQDPTVYIPFYGPHEIDFDGFPRQDPDPPEEKPV